MKFMVSMMGKSGSKARRKRKKKGKKNEFLFLCLDPS